MVEFWTGFYDGFGQNARLLDVGTGNGFLPFLAVKHAAKRDLQWEVHGVDLADIKPEKYVRGRTEALRQIKFQGRVAAEELPFEDHCFDGVTAQYAVEYGDLSRSIPEIFRVLRPGGLFCAILHHADSHVVQQNKATLGEVLSLLEGKILEDFKELLQDYWTKGRGFVPEEARHERREIEQTYLEKVKNLAASFAPERRLQVIPGIQQGLVDTLKRCEKYKLEQNLQIIEGAVSSLQEQKLILENLLDAALTDKEMATLSDFLMTTGFFRVQCRPFTVSTDQDLLGFSITAEKP